LQEHNREVEIEFQACRCRLPEAAAAAMRTNFERRGLRVRMEPAAEGQRQLIVSRVLRLELENDIGAPPFAEARLEDDQAAQEASAAQHVGPQPNSVVTIVLAASLLADWRGLEMSSRRSKSKPAWMPVFDLRTWTRTDIELFVFDDSDADQQLPLVAEAIGLNREMIEVKPPPGWNGYGVPSLP
jgi:hypothetical protein